MSEALKPPKVDGRKGDNDARRAVPYEQLRGRVELACESMNPSSDFYLPSSSARAGRTSLPPFMSIGGFAGGEKKTRSDTLRQQAVGIRMIFVSGGFPRSTEKNQARTSWFSPGKSLHQQVGTPVAREPTKREHDTSSPRPTHMWYMRRKTPKKPKNTE